MFISIHAAQEGCDVCCFTSQTAFSVFQSTQPKRAATISASVFRTRQYYFNPRSPRGLRHKLGRFKEGSNNISIHAAQEGCDCNVRQKISRSQYFNPRSPRGLRPVDLESDTSSLAIFQSTQPKRAATNRAIQPGKRFQFQSTQPKRAAT